MKAFGKASSNADTDIVISASCLKQLCAFLYNDRPRDFRLDVEIISDIMVLMRSQRSTALTTIAPGYGQGFAEASISEITC